MTFIEEKMQWLNDNLVDGKDDLILKLESKQDQSRFLQMTNWTINAFYPREEDPEEALESLEIELPPCLLMAQWEAGEFVNLAHNGQVPQPVAQFLSQYMQLVLEVADEEDEWEVTVETFTGPPRDGSQPEEE